MNSSMGEGSTGVAADMGHFRAPTVTTLADAEASRLSTAPFGTIRLSPRSGTPSSFTAIDAFTA